MPTAMIWGANSDIGYALSAELAKRNWTIVCISRDTDRLITLTPHTLEADITDHYQVQLAVTAASQLVDDVDAWFYLIGGFVPQPVADMGAENWNQTLDINLTGAFTTTHHSLPLLSPTAHLFYLGAITERLQLPQFAAYTSAKAGLDAFSQVVAKEHRKRKVTLARPGAVDTKFWDSLPIKRPKKILSPADVAVHLFDAFESGHKGKLDIVP